MAQRPSRAFQRRFPTEDACLAHLMRIRSGRRFTCFKCRKAATYYRIKARRAFECEHCGHQVYPTAGTPFEKTRTGLRDWFHVLSLFCERPNGVTAREVQRQLGVTYKTAWRMCRLIRLHMARVDGDQPGADSSFDQALAALPAHVRVASVPAEAPAVMFELAARPSPKAPIE